MTLWLLILTSAYLLGSIPFGYLLVRFLRKEDVRATGSGNIGATNVARTGGTTLGLLTLLFDALKATLPCFWQCISPPTPSTGHPPLPSPPP